MTKKDLIRKLSERLADCSAGDAAVAVNLVFDAMTAALKRGERIDVRGFGQFSVRRRQARRARNPLTGESVQMDARRTTFFRVGKELHERINRPK